MNQRKVVSAGSWAAAIVALLLGAWINRRPGSVVMRTALFVALGLVTLFYIWIQSRSMTVLQRLISAGSWAGTILVLSLGFWLNKRFGITVMWTALVGFLGLVLVLNIWMGSKAARQRLEFQELIHQLTAGKTIEQIQMEHPDFLPKIRSFSDSGIQNMLEVLDEEQARDLRRSLGRTDS